MSGMTGGTYWLLGIAVVLAVIFVHFFRAERRWLRKRDRAVLRLVDEAYDEAGFPFDQECQ